jgi:hypothetical protein
MSTTRENASDIPRPLTIGELLRQYPQRTRITGWDVNNPPAVEKAFRCGYVIGVKRFVESRGFGFVHDEPCDLELAVGMNGAIHTRRAELYDSDRWSDRWAALLRGCQHGLLDAVRARAAGVSAAKLVGWLDELEDWAAENPLNLNWSSACPPDPPDADGPPLGRDGVPRPLWCEVFGSWTLFEPPPGLPERPRGPLITSRQQYERYRRYAWEAVSRLAPPADAAERRMIEDLRAEALRTQAEAPVETAAALAHIDRIRTAPPLGNIERILHPDPAVRSRPASQPAPAEVPADRWPEPKAIAEFDCPQSLEWVWQGWVAIAHITALVAKWKAGKTTLLHHLLCARERGGDIAGAIAAGDTLVISEEHPTLWRKRSAGKRIGEHVKFICLPLISNMRDWFEFAEHVAKLVVRDGYTLVVYDTLPGLAPIQDENANSQMLAILRPLLRLKDVGTGTLLITHPPKGHTGDDFNVRGASALMGFADQLVALKRPEGDADSTQRILKCIGRLGEPLEQTIELRGSEYVTLGTKLDIERAGRRAALQAILPTEPPGLTVEEILARWPTYENKPTARSLRRNLADWLNKDGLGTKVSPTRYWW